MPCRVLLVDDSRVYLDAAARILGASERLEIVGRASSGPEALAAVDRLRPDLVLLDFSMPEMGGLELTRRLLARPDAPRIVIMSLQVDPEYREAGFRAGADGFLTKSEVDTGLIPLIDRLGLDRDVPEGAPDMATGRSR